jgi:hypothetical protein
MHFVEVGTNQVVNFLNQLVLGKPALSRSTCSNMLCNKTTVLHPNNFRNIGINPIAAGIFLSRHKL